MMTENEKNLLAQTLVKSEVKAAEPLYRKWWVWVIGAVVVINVFGNTSDNSSEPSSDAAASAVPVVVEIPENTWASWYGENATNWSMLTDALTSAEDCSNLGPAEMLACVDQIFSEAIRYGNMITPMPDVAAQSTFESWLYHVEAAQDDWRSGRYDSASQHLNSAVADINNLTSYIEAAA